MEWEQTGDPDIEKIEDMGLLPVEMGAGNFCIDEGLRQVHWMRKLMDLLPSTS